MAKTARKERLYSGIFVCEECDAEYELELVPESDFVCDDCEGALVELVESGDEEEDEDEDEEIDDEDDHDDDHEGDRLE